MRSVIITLVIGAVMIGGSLFYSSHLSNQSDKLLNTTHDIKTAIKKGDYKKANKAIDDLDKQVEHFEKFFLTTGDHIEMDNIKINISELKSFSEHEAENDALGKIYVLEFLFEHLPHNSQIRIGNIL